MIVSYYLLRYFHSLNNVIFTVIFYIRSLDFSLSLLIYIYF